MAECYPLLQYTAATYMHPILLLHRGNTYMTNQACLPFCLSVAEPTTAEEYLRRVRHEAAQCPRVVRVEMPADMQAAQRPIAALPEPDAIPDAPDWAKPSSSWVREFVDNFQDFRLQMQQAYDQGGRSADNSF